MTHHHHHHPQLMETHCGRVVFESCLGSASVTHLHLQTLKTLSNIFNSTQVLLPAPLLDPNPTQPPTLHPNIPSFHLVEANVVNLQHLDDQRWRCSLLGCEAPRCNSHWWVWQIKLRKNLLLSPAFKHCILLIRPVTLTAIADVVFYLLFLFFYCRHLFFSFQICVPLFKTLHFESALSLVAPPRLSRLWMAATSPLWWAKDTTGTKRRGQDDL